MEENVSSSILDQVEHNSRLHLINPVSYLNILALENKCDLVITDSGGLQKEAYFNKKPCVILRPETEWVEIVKNGNAVIANADKNAIVSGVKDLMGKKDALTYPSLYGDGKAASFIASEIIRNL